MLNDVNSMQSMLDEFLDFAKTEALRIFVSSDLPTTLITHGLLFSIIINLD